MREIDRLLLRRADEQMEAFDPTADVEAGRGRRRKIHRCGKDGCRRVVMKWGKKCEEHRAGPYRGAAARKAKP